MNLTGIIGHNFFRKAVVICFTLIVVSIAAIGVMNYVHRIQKRFHENLDMITQHKTYKSDMLVEGNILFLANSSFQWIFPPTDFNCYFFVKQHKINRNTDTLFNISLIAKKNIELINNDKRTMFDSQVYWDNEDFRRFLLSTYKVSSFKELNKLNTNQVIRDYATLKQTTYILTDEENMRLFPQHTIVKKFDKYYKYDQCFSYSLLNDIYLIRAY